MSRLLATFAAAFVGLLASPMAHAYKDGSYRCKNPNAGLPPAIYKIVSTDVPLAGGAVPYVEITTYFHDDPTRASSPVRETHIRGFATVSTSSDGTEILLVGERRIELKNDSPLHCTAP